MFEIVRALSVNMAQLSQNVTKLTETVTNLTNQSQSRTTADQPANNAPTPINRSELYSELFEFEERKKRGKSIIVKGIEAASNDIFTQSFAQICAFLLPDAPAPSGEVFCIDRTKNIYRVNLTTREAKMALLANAKNLNGHQMFGNVYLARDLTWNQRQDQIQRRAQARSVNSRPTNDNSPLTGANTELPGTAQPSPRHTQSAPRGRPPPP